MHMLASQGYVVIAIDSRGSRHRGLIFESHLKGRLVSNSLYFNNFNGKINKNNFMI